MTPDQLAKTLNLYANKTQELVALVEGYDFPPESPCQRDLDKLKHVVWMCEEAKTFHSVEKSMRWLGFIQGYLWVTGVFSIEEMKEHNR